MSGVFREVTLSFIFFHRCHVSMSLSRYLVLWYRSEYIYQNWEGKTVAPYYTAEYSVLCAIELNHVFIVFRSAANLAGSVQQVGQGTADSGAPSLLEV